MVQLEKLEELCLTSNFFATFPEFAMKITSLKKVRQLPKVLHRTGV